MKNMPLPAFYCTLFVLLFPVTAGLCAADTPEFDKLQASYRNAVEQATKGLREAHLRELETLRDTYTRAGNLNAANKVQAQIDAIYHSIAFAASPGNSKEPPPAAMPPEVRAANTPDLDRLQAAYEAGIETATKGTRDIYLKELQKLHDTYLRAAGLDAANKTQAEMERIRNGGKNANASGPVVSAPEVRWIAGKEWVTGTGTHFAFGKNGKGEKSHPSSETTPFTWSILTSGLVEVWVKDTMKSAPRAWYIHFKNRSEADYGISPTKLDLQMRSR
jgi:hypothetical protein